LELKNKNRTLTPHANGDKRTNNFLHTIYTPQHLLYALKNRHRDHAWLCINPIYKNDSSII